MWSKSSLSYCTNVHPGTTLEQLQHTLTDYCAAVRNQRGLAEQAAGLWLTESLATELLDDEVAFAEFKKSMSDSGIALLTLNGFPQQDFHQPVVKEQVYSPDWSDKSRLDYTWSLVEILLHGGVPGINSISTLPLGFAANWNSEKHQAALEQLGELAWRLNNLQQFTGKRIVIGLEMEPGCVLQTTTEMVAFFDELAEHCAERGVSREVLLRNIGCCFDVCHQAVMWEDIHESLTTLTAAGIQIHKIQLSNAIRVVNPDSLGSQQDILPFVEPKFLHQTTVPSEVEPPCQLHLDLDQAIANADRSAPEWRVHYHVPIHSESLTPHTLLTTQSAIGQTLDFLKANPQVTPHLEVETYTWTSLPGTRPSPEQLVEGLTAEMHWLEQQLELRGLLSDD